MVKSTRSNATLGPGGTAIRLRRSTFCTAGESLKASLAGGVRKHSAYAYWATLQQYHCSDCPFHMPLRTSNTVCLPFGKFGRLACRSKREQRVNTQSQTLQPRTEGNSPDCYPFPQSLHLQPDEPLSMAFHYLVRKLFVSLDFQHREHTWHLVSSAVACV